MPDSRHPISERVSGTPVRTWDSLANLRVSHARLVAAHDALVESLRHRNALVDSALADARAATDSGADARSDSSANGSPDA